MNDLESLFNETIELVYTVFGESAFLAPSITQESKSPRKIIYDSLMQVFSKNLIYKTRIIANAETIRKTRYFDPDFLLCQEKNRHLFDGRYHERKDVENRIEYFNKFLQGFIKNGGNIWI